MRHRWLLPLTLLALLVVLRMMDLECALASPQAPSCCPCAAGSGTDDCDSPAQAVRPLGLLPLLCLQGLEAPAPQPCWPPLRGSHGPSSSVRSQGLVSPLAGFRSPPAG